MTQLAISTPSDVEAELPAVVSWARDLNIQTADDFADAGEQLKRIKGMGKRIADFFRPMKQKQDEAKRALLDAEKKLATPLEEAEAIAKRAMLTYQQAEAAKAEAERLRLQAIADEKARKERLAAEQEAAKQRQIEADARAKAEAARLAAEQASAADKRKLLAEAEAADRKAAAAAVKVEAKVEQASQVVAPVVHVATVAPQVKGIATKQNWTYRITDEKLIPRDYLMVDEKKLAAFARAMKDGVKVPGVEFYAEQSLSSARY